MFQIRTIASWAILVFIVLNIINNNYKLLNNNDKLLNIIIREF